MSLTVSLVTFTDRQAAIKARGDYLANPAAFDQTIAEQAAGTGQEPATAVPVTLHQAPTLASSGLFTAPVGSYVLATDGTTVIVARVDSRTVSKAPIPEAALQADASVKDQIIEAFGALLLAELVDDTKVEVNPRYRVWDPMTAQVVPGANAL